MSTKRPHYLIIADSECTAEKIRQVYEKNKLFANFNINVAYSCCSVFEPNSSFVIIDPMLHEVRDSVLRYRWYMPKGAKLFLRKNAWGARIVLESLSTKQYDAVVNACCSPGPRADAEFWYTLESVNINPKEVVRLPIDGFWDDDIVKMVLMALNNRRN